MFLTELRDLKTTTLLSLSLTGIRTLKRLAKVVLRRYPILRDERHPEPDRFHLFICSTTSCAFSNRYHCNFGYRCGDSRLISTSKATMGWSTENRPRQASKRSKAIQWERSLTLSLSQKCSKVNFLETMLQRSNYRSMLDVCNKEKRNL